MFAGTRDFGSTELQNTNGSTEGFIAQMDTNGNWLRAQQTQTDV